MEKQVLGMFDLHEDDYNQLWNKFIPIADSLNMVFSWEQTADGDIQLAVTGKNTGGL
ncbi:MAG: hypothetical protein PF693_07550 [Spirochaetia bacterium]|nr:hypothetical protein [Spirochaetia bacterium]